MEKNAKKLITIENIYFIIALFLFANLLYYYLTGSGGGTRLAVRMVPVTIILYVLRCWRDGKLYPKLSDTVNKVMYIVYISIAFISMVYMWIEFENILLYRLGSYSKADLMIGIMMFILVMEISRKIHTVLFGVNVVLLIYSLTGMYSPIDFFWHPGISLTRIITASTLEMSTGVYGQYAQIALTTIGAFLLIAAISDSFGGQQSIVNVVYSIFGTHTYNVPQIAVVTSAVMGMVSGSGAANTSITGSFSIPLMVRNGIRPSYAAAVETAASNGGLVMPPLMGIAAFIMADILGVEYWQVVLRGFGIAFIYFAAVTFCVYLISRTEITPSNLNPPKAKLSEKIDVLIFFISLTYLIIVMGVYGYGAMRAAVNTSFIMIVLFICSHCYFKYYRKDERYKDISIIKMLKDTIENHADLVYYLVLLLAVLGIMIGLFTTTGFIIRMGNLIMSLGESNVILTILVAALFGWLTGMGLPLTANYIILAVTILPPIIAFGVNPWVGHFFIFLLAMWGEVTPPTAMTAAVAARIAKAPYLSVMYHAFRISAPIVFLTFGVFVRDSLVVAVGWAQVINVLVATVAVLGFSFVFFGFYSPNKLYSYSMKIIMSILSAAIFFHPSFKIALVATVLTSIFLVFGIRQHNKVCTEIHSKDDVLNSTDILNSPEG